MGSEPMTMKNIQEAKDPDLRASVAAMSRAAQAARKTAMQTGTNLIVVKDASSPASQRRCCEMRPQTRTADFLTDNQ